MPYLIPPTPPLPLTYATPQEAVQQVMGTLIGVVVLVTLTTLVIAIAVPVAIGGATIGGLALAFPTGHNP